jgi:predicted GNAT superfamily acetyltransferase
VAVQAEHWRLARQAADRAAVTVRQLSSLEDADLVIDVEAATWGAPEVTREVFRALAESGNHLYGAFDGQVLVGFVLGWLGTGDEGVHVHSHTLAVLEPWRARGVGYALKVAQRAVALDRGVNLIRWTFDPLLARNAHFNLGKLGAISERFARNFYGTMTDALNRSDRSDRLVVRWELARPPGPRPSPPGEPRELVMLAGTPDATRPVRSGLQVVGEGVWSVAVPWDYPALKANEPELAAVWRDVVADVLAAALEAGLVAAAFEADREQRSARYLLAAGGGSAA